ncbi:MAG: hypothetical protein J5806_08240 [Lentisphaeria bacterium]|nr:hypothetical protein [Lentisphaeria bacterium]
MRGKRWIFFTCLFCGFLTVNAQNLVQDGECDDPKSGELAIVEGVQQGALTHFEENLSWNHCWKLEIQRYKIAGNGSKSINLCVRIGRGEKQHGFVCEPNTSYSFSLEIKGNAPRAMINFYEWNDAEKTTWHNMKKGKSSVHLIHPQKEWTVYRGTFKTGPTAKRAALCVQFWGDEKYKDLPEKPGDYILIDKILIEKEQPRLTAGPAAQPTAAVETVPTAVVRQQESPDGTIDGFFDFSAKRPNPWSRSTVFFRHDGKNLIIRMRYQIPAGTELAAEGKSIWDDDMTEIFLSADPATKKYRQFVISARGKRWYGDGSPRTPADADQWKSTARIGKDAWEAEAVIPFSMLGIKTPEPGTVIRFNIARQRMIPGRFEKPDMSKGNRWNNYRMRDISSAAYPFGMAADKYDQSGVLVIDSLQPLADRVRKETVSAEKSPAVAGMWKKFDPNRPANAYAQLMAIRKEARMFVLSQRKFLLNRVPLSVNPDIPFFPRELGNEESVFHVRAAVNEYASLALALGNMTDSPEEYRVFVSSGWAFQEPSQERAAPFMELRRADGKSFPASKLTIRRGVPFKDSASKGHGQRLDILAKLNEAGTVPVQPKTAGLLWFTFDCTGVEPGLYKGWITVLPLNGQISKFQYRTGSCTIEGELEKYPLELEVLPIELPRLSPMPNSAVERLLRDDQGDFMVQYDSFMYMVTPWYFTFQYNPDGSIKEYTVKKYLYPELDRLTRHLQAHRKIIAQPAVRVGHSVYEVWKKHLVPKNFRFDSAEYWNAWRNYCLGIDRILRKYSIPRKQYTLELFDEPQPKQYPAEELLKAHRECKKAMPDCSIQLVAGAGYIQEDAFFKQLADVIDIWTFIFYRTQEPEQRKRMLEFKAMPGKHLQIYACGISARQDLYRYYRMLPWNAMEIGADSVSIYRLFPTMTLINDLYNPTEGEMVYMIPGAILPSIRLENYLAGMNDVKYLKLLEKMAGGNSPQDKADREFVRKAVRDVYLVSPHDSSLAGKIREQTIQRILKRIKK